MAADPFADLGSQPALHKDPFADLGRQRVPLLADPFADLGRQPKKKAIAPLPVASATVKGARPSVLREAAEYLGAPISLLSAGWQSLPAPFGAPNGENTLGEAGALVRHPTYENIEKLNQQFDPFQAETYQRYGIDPKKVSPWLSALGELSANWYSPGNTVLGGATKLAGKAGSAARATIPGLEPFAQMGDALNLVGQRLVGEPAAAAIGALTKGAGGVARSLPGAVGAAARSLLDRYTGLAARGGQPYVHAAMAANAAPEHAVAQGDNFFDNIGKGLTLKQQREMQRLSYVDEHGVPLAQERDTSIPEPKKGPSLEERAMAVRRYMMGRDAIQDVLGLRKQVAGEQYDPGSFFPMRQFKDNPVYASQEKGRVEPLPLGDKVELGKPEGRGGFSRNKFSGNVAKTGHKEQGPLLTDEDWSDIHPEYSPIFQLKEHYADVNRAIANESARRGLEELPSINPETGAARTINIPGLGEVPLKARMPLFYGMLDREAPVVFGQGEEGARNMQSYIERQARGKAASMARQDPRVVAMAKTAGIDPQQLGTRSVREMNLRPLQQRIAEAQRGQVASGKLAQNVAGIRQRGEQAMAKALQPLAEPGTVKPATRAFNAGSGALSKAEGAAAGLDAKTTQRVNDLQEAFTQRAASSGTAEAFNRSAQQYYKDVVGTIKQQVESEVAKTAAPEGYVKESTLGIGTPTSRDMALDDSFANFMRTQPKSMFGEDAGKAKSFWDAWQTLNRLARASIVLVPTVHGINNLGMAYLSEGGTPEDMAAILTGRKTFDPALRNRAYDAGAASDTSQQSFLWNNESPMWNATPAEHADAIAAKAGPFSKVVRPAARGAIGFHDTYNAMNRWLFKNAEQGYAIDLFDRFTKAGMSDGEAALRVRNALGRYDNLSARELAYNLNRIFYFYPWMKTVIPFWVKKGVVDPKWWSAPVRGIETLNQGEGFDDPSKPFTMTVANLGNGEFLRATAPLPQRVLSDVADLARLPADLASGSADNMLSDLKPSVNYVASHFNPMLQVGYAGTQAAMNGAENVAPFNPFHAQPGESAAQYASRVTENLPGQFFAPVERLQSFNKDPIGTIAGFLAGSFTYSQKDQSRKHREATIRQEIDAWLAPAIRAARLSGDQTRIDSIQQLRESLIGKTLQKLDAAPLQPLPIPSANDPFADLGSQP